MELKVKNLNISSSENVALIHFINAREFGIKQGDRIKVKFGKFGVIVLVDIAFSSSIIKRNEIGIYSDLKKKLNCKNNSIILIEQLSTPSSVVAIKKKLSGIKLNESEFLDIITDIVEDKLTDVEKTFFVSACYFNELTIDEIIYFTKAMVSTGTHLNFQTSFKINSKKNALNISNLKSSQTIIADKHCIGGVAGNRTTCFVVPIIALAGYKMPKTSSRSITSPSGTADTMEVLCNVTLNQKQMINAINKVNAFMVWGGANGFVPSDSKLIKIEHPVSLTPVGQMIASVLSKKKAAGSTHCLIDIPIGKGSKVEKKSKAKLLKKLFEKVGKAIDLKVKVIFTDGTEPIGNGIGPALEARDLLWTLNNDKRGSVQLKEKGIQLAGELLKLLGEKRPYILAKEIVESGRAANKFNEILEEQGLIQNNPLKIKIGKYELKVLSIKTGKVKFIDNKQICDIAKIAGAPKDKGAGLYLNFHKKDFVNKGDCLYTIYSNSKLNLLDAKKLVKLNNGYLI